MSRPAPDAGGRSGAGPSWEAMTRLLGRRLAVSAAAMDPAARRIVLVGPMGAGKTTVGRVLSRTTGMAFVDADELFVTAFGPIPAFFSAHGEPAFRAGEARVIAHVLDHPVPCVLACGGGAVVTAATRRLLRRPESLVVQLQVGEEEALARLGGGEGRPVLAGDPAGTWRRILAERAPLYREVSDLTVDGTGEAPAVTASRIVEAIHHPRRSDTRP